MMNIKIEKLDMSYSSPFYEGVLADSWRDKPHHDRVWVEINSLKTRLYESRPIQEQVTVHTNPQNVMEGIECLLTMFKKTQRPIGITTRNSWENINFNPFKGMGLKPKIVKYTFIRNVKKGRLICLMCAIYTLLKNDKYITKRELFYQNKDIMSSQNVINGLIDDLCCITRYSRYQLHILSSPRGLITGDLEFILDGKQINCRNHQYGLTITQEFSKISVTKCDAKFILIVEKEATFQTLLTNKFLVKFPAIILTGRGYPDLDTRRFVNILVSLLKIPIFGLADANPYGIEIMLTYKYGSLSLAYDAERVVIPALRWLGLLSTDFKTFRIDEDMLQPLSKSDIRKIASLKKRPFVQKNDKWDQQLDYMLYRNTKAELSAVENIVELFLPYKLRKGLWV